MNKDEFFSQWYERNKDKLEEICFQLGIDPKLAEPRFFYRFKYEILKRVDKNPSVIENLKI